MFGFLKTKTYDLEPLQFELAVDVDAPAERAFALVDWADPGNAKRELGHRVETLDESGRHFLLVLDSMPDHRFEMVVSEDDKPHSYAFTTDIQPPVGKLDWSKEIYRVEPRGADRCKLFMTVIVKFQNKLSMREVEHEMQMMTAACQNSLIKLKVHAEHGAEVVKQIEREQFG